MKTTMLNPGENVRHRARAEWGIGKITTVNNCGTIGVVFEGNRILSIAKGINFLIKVNPDSTNPEKPQAAGISDSKIRAI